MKKNLIIPSNKMAIALAFSRAALRYDQAALLQKETGFRLLETAPDVHDAWVLDAGCGTGCFSQYWRQKGNRVLALDLSPDMLEQAKKKSVAEAYLSADIEQLPMTDQKINLCFSNMAIQWCDDFKAVLAEFYRVTRPGGSILFSTLAIGSLKELAQAWKAVDGQSHINHFLSFEEIHQLCLPYHFELKTQLSTLFFSDVIALIHSLKGVGANHLHQGRKPGLTGRQSLRRLEEAYPVQAGGYPLSYQLVYGKIYRE